MKNNNVKATSFIYIYIYRHNNNKILNISYFLNDTIINFSYKLMWDHMSDPIKISPSPHNLFLIFYIFLQPIM